MTEITYTKSLELENLVYIDVRSPGEFDIDHIPGSINMPIFDNEERSEIGKIYKMIGKDKAIIRGTEVAGKKLASITDEISKHKGKNIIILCARGGMRSGSITALLNSLGLNVCKLRDGYKGYRHHVLDKLESIGIKPPLFVLQGLTGTGKTEIIRRIDNSIDLEDMAGHRSSIFGGIGLKQNTQKGFESLLIDRIDNLQNEEYIIIEGESRKIGNLHIPQRIFKQMKNSPALLISAPIDRRVDIILNEYSKSINQESIADIVKSLKSKLGEKNIDTLLRLFNEGNLREFIKILLEKYYDPLYKYSLEKIEYIEFIENLNTHDIINQLDRYIKSYLNK